jgi:hypothetical protein
MPPRNAYFCYTDRGNYLLTHLMGHLLTMSVIGDVWRCSYFSERICSASCFASFAPSLTRHQRWHGLSVASFPSFRCHARYRRVTRPSAARQYCHTLCRLRPVFVLPIAIRSHNAIDHQSYPTIRSHALAHPRRPLAWWHPKPHNSQKEVAGGAVGLP